MMVLAYLYKSSILMPAKKGPIKLSPHTSYIQQIKTLTRSTVKLILLRANFEPSLVQDTVIFLALISADPRVIFVSSHAQ